MNIHEYQAKQLFLHYSIPVPDGKQATTPESAEQVAKELGGDGWVVKAQVHAGGRGKVGGVKLAKTLAEVAEFSRGMLGKRLVTKQTGAEGLPINSLLIEKNLPDQTRVISERTGRPGQRAHYFYCLGSGRHGYRNRRS